jgi:phosphoserine aminotransferase
VDRVWNFSAGPATLPVWVLEVARDEMLSFPDAGMSVLEMSHRSKWFESIVGEAEANLRELLAIPADYRVLFMQGGASLQFSMVPMNFLRGGSAPADYVVSGSWAKKAVVEAKREGEVRVVWDGAEDAYSTLPDLRQLEVAKDGAYLHVTSNETIEGIEFQPGFEPESGPPLICDASSDFLSRPLPVGRYGMIYAGAQKNAGPAGLTVVILREDLLERIPDGLHTMLDYRTFSENASLYNTPPSFPIYVLMLITRWLRTEIGGLQKMHDLNLRKAGLLYSVIDGSDGFYRGHAAEAFRSAMNVTWRLPTEDLEKTFVQEATAARLLELKGHRSVGGCRASVYNAMPLKGAEALATFMREFATTRG